MQKIVQNKSLVKNNVLKFLEYKGLSKYEFYKITGITRGVLDQNNGMSEKNTARFLAVYKEVSPDWLITDKGEMLRKDDYINKASPLAEVNESVSSHCKLCEAKDIVIRTQQETIAAQRKIISCLENELKQKKSR